MKTITKKQLALEYFPHTQDPATAVRHLMRWIHKCQPLHKQLTATGYNKHAKCFMPLQVKLIIEYLGEP